MEQVGQFAPWSFTNSTEDRPPAVGRVFYVRSDGADTNNGVSPGTPFASITHALTECTNWKNDYIIVMNNCSANEAGWPIAVDVNLVHIVGLWGSPYPNPTLGGVGAAVFQLSVDWIEIAGIDMGCGAANACIESLGTAVTIGHWWIHHNTFGYIVGYTGQDGIGVLATDDAPQCVIEDNIFGSALTRDGIRLAGNATRTIIRNNYFRRVPGIGINMTVAGGDLGAILDNKFFAAIADAEPAGWAITITGAACGYALISGNIASQTGDGTGNNPYRDTSTGVIGTTLNGWGMNYSGQAVIAPATV